MPPLFNASYTSPEHRLVTIGRANAVAATGKPPQLTITNSAPDARYFRSRGVPTLIFGPKVHLGTALDVLLDDARRAN